MSGWKQSNRLNATEDGLRRQISPNSITHAKLRECDLETADSSWRIARAPVSLREDWTCTHAVSET